MSEQATAMNQPPPIVVEDTLSTHKWGMISFLVSEVAFFSTLLVAYVSYIGKDTAGPTPEILSLPLVLCTTTCLLASSTTIHFAETALHQANIKRFHLLWFFTIILGVAFIGGTGYEWYDLMLNQNFFISTNLFGTTFYTLVGFHALHVSVGIIVLSIFLCRSLQDKISHGKASGAQLISWYWHFVDGVWVVVFLVVYVLGR